MAELLAVPLKKTSDVDLVQPLTNLIRSSFSTADQPEDFSAEIKELSELRASATRYGYGKPETSLDFMNRYYDQLLVLEQKLPVNEVQIPFKWKDAFDRGTIFGGRVRLTISSLAFERVCILFNIAATQSAIAEKQSIDNDDELKLAAKYLQQAAGIFHQLRDSVVSAIHQEPTPDLSADTLLALESLMLAQAQEIFTRKAIQDKMKDGVIAKLCAQCEDMYADCLKNLQRDSVRHLWDKDWISIAAGKQAAFHGLSQYFQAQVCHAAKNVGEEIARLENANELLKAAQTRSGRPNFFADYLAKTQKQLTDSKRDNDFIYNAHIPDVKMLPAVAKAALAKPTPVPEKLHSSAKDLFERLCPVVVHQALAAFDVRRADIVSSDIGQLRDATNLLNSTLASLNLPAAIEDTTGDELPQSILEKNQAIISAGGIKALQNMINELPELLQRNKDILDEGDRLLNEEKESDDQLRAQFKEKWNRTPSEKLTKTLCNNASKYRIIIDNAIQADETVRANFEAHRKGMELLSLPKDQLQKAVPSGSGLVGQSSSSSALATLRQLMEEVATVKAEREVIESELKSATFDMKHQFLQALQKDGVIAESVISTEALGHGLGALRQQRMRTCEEQQALITRIQSAHEEWIRGSSQSPSKRDEVLKSLSAAYDAFMKLQGDLKEGSKFYNELTHLLVVLQNQITDYCFARRTEKEELLKELTRDASKGSSMQSINIPAHHAASIPKQPPPRPPPPTTAPTAPAAPTTNLPYPTAPYNMPTPYGAVYTNMPPMPQGYNPYGTLPYPHQPQNYPGYQVMYPAQPYPGYPGPGPQQQQPPHGTW